MMNPGLLCAGFMMVNVISEPPPATQNTLRGGPQVVHEFILLHDRDSRGDGWSSAAESGDGQQRFVSVVRATPIPFNELIPSWNLQAGPSEEYQVELRVGRGEPPTWSAWYWFGPARLPATGTESQAAPVVRDPFGEVRTDYLVLSQPCEHIQARITFRASEPHRAQSRVDRFAVAISNTTGDKRLWDARRIKPKKWERAAYTRRLDVPFMTQHVQTTEMQGNVCSPTSVAMVMAYRGVRKSTEDVARTAYDRLHKIYGNWPLNVQAAYSFGVPGHIRRFATMDEAHACIAQGQPIIASIRDPQGQLQGTPYKTTLGHLLVICGFDEKGNVLVNDPAGRDAAHGQLIYDPKQFEQAWLGAGGVAYIFEPVSTARDPAKAGPETGKPLRPNSNPPK